jgi:hypothetical protein
MSTLKSLLTALLASSLLGGVSSLQAQTVLTHEAELVAGDPQSTDMRPFNLRRGRFLVEARLYVFEHAQDFVPLLDEFGEPWVEHSLVLCGTAAPAGLASDPSSGLYVMPHGVHVSMELELGAHSPILGVEPYRTIFLRTQVIRLHPDVDEVLDIEMHSDLQLVQLNSFWTGFTTMPGWRPRLGGDLPRDSVVLLERIAEKRGEQEHEPISIPVAMGE